MASLSKEKSGYRIHWKFAIKAGPRAGELIEGSLSLGRCTKAIAKTHLRKMDEWEEKVRTGRLLPHTALDDVIDAWLKERRLSCTEQTVARTVRVLNRYKAWRESRGLGNESITVFARRAELIAFRDYRLEHEAGNKTVASDLGTISEFFKWCVREHHLVDNPMDHITRPRFEVKQEGTPLTRPQAGRLIRAIRPKLKPSDPGPRNWELARRRRHLLVFLLNTGLRAGELCDAKIEDLRVDDHERQLSVVGKGRKQRWVPINRAALAAVQLHLRSRGNPTSGPLFVTPTGKRCNVRQLGSEISQCQACIDEPMQLNPHNLRHTFATWLVRAGCPVAVAQKILGHENVNTTLKYYVHTEDHELHNATANLRGRRERTQTAPPPAAEPMAGIIPFPSHLVSRGA